MHSTAETPPSPYTKERCIFVIGDGTRCHRYSITADPEYCPYHSLAFTYAAQKKEGDFYLKHIKNAEMSCPATLKSTGNTCGRPGKSPGGYCGVHKAQDPEYVPPAKKAEGVVDKPPSLHSGSQALPSNSGSKIKHTTRGEDGVEKLVGSGSKPLTAPAPDGFIELNDFESIMSRLAQAEKEAKGFVDPDSMANDSKQSTTEIKDSQIPKVSTEVKEVKESKGGAPPEVKSTPPPTSTPTVVDTPSPSQSYVPQTASYSRQSTHDLWDNHFKSSPQTQTYAPRPSAQPTQPKPIRRAPQVLLY